MQQHQNSYSDQQEWLLIIEAWRRKNALTQLETGYADITGIHYSGVSMEPELKHLPGVCDPYPALSNGPMVPDSSPL